MCIRDRGKVVLIDFTVYNNAMSAAHNLALRELYNKYASQGFEIYQISLDLSLIHISSDEVGHIGCVNAQLLAHIHIQTLRVGDTHHVRK